MNWSRLFDIVLCILTFLLVIGVNIITGIGIYSDITSNNINNATIIVPIVILFLDFLLFWLVGDL